MLSSSARRAAAALAASAALAGAIASPAAAAPRTVDVVNLGDSYSAAIGTGGIVATSFSLLDGRACVQGQGTDHVDRLGQRVSVNLLVDASCSGATAADIEAIALSDAVRPQLAEAELVTLTLGGNDTGWGDYVGACSEPGAATLPAGTCDFLLSQADARITAAAAAAAQTVGTIAGQTDGQIVVFGYPRLFEGEQDTAFLTEARADQLNALTDELNAALRESVAGVDGAQVVFVDVTDRFAGRGADSEHPWIYFDPSNPLDYNNLHPTEQGYLTGYYPALMSAISPGQLGR